MKNVNSKNEKPKNDVIYVRVSTGEQVAGFSLDNQEKYCQEFSNKTGYSVLVIFREEGESAKTANRTKLQEMLRYCEKNKKQISRVVVYKVDRFSRTTADYLALKAVLNKLDISLVSATEGFENTPSGKLNETILSAFAQFDNDVRSQRTSEGMKARLLNGLWSGIAPWGYINTKDELGNKIIAPHPEKAPVVKMLFEQYATGKYSFRELANMANKMGVKSRHGMKMGKQLVSKIIANPIYCGRIVVRKFEVSTQGSHETIISESLFDEANSNDKGVAGHRLCRNKDSPELPLRGIQCGLCGKNMTGGRTMGKMKKKYYYYYNCYNHNCSKKGLIQQKDLHDDFTKFLKEITPNSDYFEVLKESIRIAHKTELQSVTTLERKLDVKIAELKNNKDKLIELRVAGEIKPEDYASTMEKYKIQISELEKEVNSLYVPELEIDSVVDSGVEFLKHLSERWKDLDVKDLRVLRPLLFPENLTYQYPTIKTPKLCPIYNVKSEFGDEKSRWVTPQRIEL